MPSGTVVREPTRLKGKERRWMERRMTQKRRYVVGRKASMMRRGLVLRKDEVRCPSMLDTRARTLC
jgi:hypothetical protein